MNAFIFWACMSLTAILVTAVSGDERTADRRVAVASGWCAVALPVVMALAWVATS